MSFENHTAVGQGSYSKVIIDNDNSIAIKIFKDTNSLAAIKEIAIINYLNHPNVIKLLNIRTETTLEQNENCITFLLYMKKYDSDLSKIYWLENKNKIYSTNVILSETNLFSAPKTYFTPMSYLLKCMHDVTSGLKYLHSKKIIHGDIKPENLLYDIKTNTTVICDFNISVLNPRSKMDPRIQSLMFRAPEVNMASDELCYFNDKIDVWSVGCILFGLLTKTFFITKCTNDSSTNAVAEFGLFRATNFEGRLKELSLFTMPVAKIYFKTRLHRVQKSQFETSNNKIVWIPQPKWYDLYDIADDLVPKYTELFSDLLAGCLTPTAKERWTSELLYKEVNKVIAACNSDIKIWELPNENPKEQTDLALSLNGMSDFLIADMMKDITPLLQGNAAQSNLLHALQSIDQIKVEEDIYKMFGAGSVTKNVKLLEIAYYKATMTKKHLGSKSSLICLISCLYIVCSMYDRVFPAVLYNIVEYSALFTKSVDIIKALNYKLIL